MTTPAYNPELIERLAGLMHEIWAGWQEYVFLVSIDNETGTVTIPADRVQQWRRQIQTSYSMLGEDGQNEHRRMARKVLALLDRYGQEQIAKALEDVLKLPTHQASTVYTDVRPALVIAPSLQEFTRWCYENGCVPHRSAKYILEPVDLVGRLLVAESLVIIGYRAGPIGDTLRAFVAANYPRGDAS